MGRPKLEKPTTSKERMQKYRKDEAKRAAENRRQADARKKKNQNVTLTEEELQEKRRNPRQRKRLSQANMLTCRVEGQRENPEDEELQPGKSLAIIALYNFNFLRQVTSGETESEDWDSMWRSLEDRETKSYCSQEEYDSSTESAFAS